MTQNDKNLKLIRFLRIKIVYNLAGQETTKGNDSNDSNDTKDLNETTTKQEENENNIQLVEIMKKVSTKQSSQYSELQNEGEPEAKLEKTEEGVNDLEMSENSTTQGM